MNSSSAIDQLRDLSHTGSGWDPVIDVFFFLASSMVIIWRLEAISARGVEGTILGTLFMPYFSGLGNLLFVYVILRNGGPGGEVLINCVVNNATNITLIVGLCGLIWPLVLGGQRVVGRGKTKAPMKRPKKAETQVRLHRLSLVFTMLAMLFFTGIAWALGRDGSYDQGEGWTLIGIFLFWQAFHVFEVLKDNVRQGSSWHPLIALDLFMIAGASLVLYFSVEWLVEWMMAAQSGFFSAQQLGLLTGWLMVLPNAIVAFYYAWRRKSEVVFASQFGDAHICIPLCIGLYAAFATMPVAPAAIAGLLFILAVCVVNLASLAFFGKLHRWTAAFLVLDYIVYLIFLA